MMDVGEYVCAGLLVALGVYIWRADFKWLLAKFWVGFVYVLAIAVAAGVGVLGALML